MKINATEHVVPHDDAQAGMTRVDIVEDTSYVSNEQVDGQLTVLSHVLLTGVTQANVKHLTHTYTHVALYSSIFIMYCSQVSHKPTSNTLHTHV